MAQSARYSPEVRERAVRLVTADGTRPTIAERTAGARALIAMGNEIGLILRVMDAGHEVDLKDEAAVSCFMGLR